MTPAASRDTTTYKQGSLLTHLLRPPGSPAGAGPAPGPTGGTAIGGLGQAPHPPPATNISGQTVVGQPRSWEKRNPPLETVHGGRRSGALHPDALHPSEVPISPWVGPCAVRAMPWEWTSAWGKPAWQIFCANNWIIFRFSTHPLTRQLATLRWTDPQPLTNPLKQLISLTLAIHE